MSHGTERECFIYKVCLMSLLEFTEYSMLFNREKLYIIDV